MKDTLRVLLWIMMACFWSCSPEDEEIPEPAPTPTPEVDNHEAIERAALIEFYQATGGDNWTNKTNWCSDEPLNEWYGITRTNGYTTGIELDSNNLTGSIPECIGNLSKLKELSLEWNQLTDSIPDSIWNLTNLEDFRVGGNQLTGSIPESIGNLTKLRWLVLRENQFSGSIPESIGKLSQMRYIDFDRNQFTGSIPECIGNLTALFSLDLAFNQFTGNIPSSLGKLTELWRLMLRNNQLTGSIPESIGNLVNLEVINFMNNSLSGKIPASLTKLEAWKNYWHAVIQGNPELDLEGAYIPAPSFSLIDPDGNQIISLNEYNKNKLTILYDWGTWCPNSNAFNSTLLYLYNTYHKYGMEIIGSCNLENESPKALEETISYLEKNSIPWRNIIVSTDNRIAIFNIDRFLPCIIAVDNNKQIIFQSITEDYNELVAVVHEYFESATESVNTTTD